MLSTVVLNHLSPWDIVTFIAYTMALLSVGLYFTRQQKSLKTFLVADQSVPWYIVGVSVLAALFSGVTYLGGPAEAFFHDLTYTWAIASMVIATPITALIFVPLFRKAQIYTAYEYLEQRFDARLRYIASGLFILRVTAYLAVVIYAPSLAIMEVTGWPLWAAILLIAACATIYTCLGGMQAVIWTDTLQFLILCAGIVLILCFAISKVPGGMSAAWRTAAADGKTSLFNFSPDPRVRLTVWGCLLGGAASTLVQLVTDQMAVQRYLTAPSLRDCQRALWLKLWISIPLISLFYLAGTVLYAYYRVTPASVPNFKDASLVPALAQGMTNAAPISNDRILPYFVVHVLPSPLRGLLIAALFGATIGTVSAGIHSLATAAMVDFGRKDGEHGAGESLHRVRMLILLFGALATILAMFVVPLLGTIVQAVVSIIGVFGGPLLGVFMLGALSRRVNANAALIGAAVGALAGALVLMSSYWPRYQISFMWISFVATAVTYVTGLLVAWITRSSPSIERPAIETGEALEGVPL